MGQCLGCTDPPEAVCTIDDLETAQLCRAECVIPVHPCCTTSSASLGKRVDGG